MRRPKYINIEDLKNDTVYVQIDSPEWRTPEYISLNSILNSNKISSNNTDITIKLVKFVDQDVSINNDPSTYDDNDDNLNMSTDENFLYVWVKNRWKRVPLSDF